MDPLSSLPPSRPALARRPPSHLPWASIVALAVSLAGAGCASLEGSGSPSRPLEFRRRPNLPAILTLMPDSPSARETYRGLVDELGEEYDVIPYITSKDMTPGELTRLVREQQPRALVLMNNPNVRLYRQYRVVAPPEQRDLPAVVVLTSFLRESAAGLDNLTGVIYEVPLVTSLVNLRVLLEQPVRSVGVIHRPIFRRFLEEQRRLSAAEGFTLVGVEVSGEDSDEIEQALERLLEVEKVHALWVLNDNALLTREHLVDGWLPGLEGSRTPVIVNVRSLVSREISFGTFAVLPDHRPLGVQAAQLLSTIAEQGWRIPFPGEYEYPVTVRKVLDLRFARRNLELREQQLVTIDQLVE